MPKQETWNNPFNGETAKPLKQNPVNLNSVPRILAEFHFLEEKHTREQADFFFFFLLNKITITTTPRGLLGSEQSQGPASSPYHEIHTPVLEQRIMAPECRAESRQWKGVKY